MRGAIEKMMEYMEDGIQGIIIRIFSDIAEAAVNFMLQILGGIHSASINVFEYDFVLKGILLAQGIGIMLLAIRIAYESLVTYILRISGDATADPGGLLIRAMVSVAIIGSMPWLPIYVYRIGTAVAADISRLPGNDPAEGLDTNVFLSLLQDGFALPLTIIFMAVLIIVSVVMILIVIIQMSIRSAELAFIGILGPIMAIGLNSNLFGQWWKKLISIVLAQAAQLLTLRFSFYILHALFFNFDVMAFIFFIGFLWVTVKSPKILEQLIDSTGLGRFVGGVGMAVSSRMMMRRVFTRGI